MGTNVRDASDLADDLRRLANLAEDRDVSIAEILRQSATAIDDLVHRVDMEDIFLAGLGEFERFEKVYNELSKR